MIEWRRDLHRHPELGFEEHWTAAYVVDRLRTLGLDLRCGVAGTGVVATLRATHPIRSTMLLRADMDALPIREVAGRAYGSEIDGRMHACGHDGHMAMLLGAASILAAERESLPGDVVLCFQPGEEGHGGAMKMIEAGVLEWDDVREAYGVHLWSPFPAGSFHVRPGPAMAAQDEFHAKVIGRGGHGALPHAAIDPIVAAAHVVSALQTIVSRSVDPIEPAVVTVGLFHSGTAPNVIPHEAVLGGTLRSFSEPVRQRLRTRVREVIESTSTAFGCRAEIQIVEGYPALINEPAAAARMRQVAETVFGPDRVHEMRPVAAAEDFAYFLERRPGAFAFVGAGNAERQITAPHHSNAFDIDESVLPLGSELFARLALVR